MAPLLEFNDSFFQEANASTSSFPLEEGPAKPSTTEADIAEEGESAVNTTARKSVTFRSRIKIRECLHINDYTDEEVDACWYTAAEAREIRHELKETRNLIESGLLEQDTDEYCRRGADTYTELDCSRRHSTKIMAWEAVFNEQDYQTDTGANEPLYISHLYKAACHQESRRAHAVALKDELDAIM